MTKSTVTLSLKGLGLYNEEFQTGFIDREDSCKKVFVIRAHCQLKKNTLAVSDVQLLISRVYTSYSLCTPDVPALENKSNNYRYYARMVTRNGRPHTKTASRHYYAQCNISFKEIRVGRLNLGTRC